MPKGKTALVVTETHRIELDDGTVAKLLAEFINDTGKAVTYDGVGIYDFDNIQTTYTADVE